MPTFKDLDSLLSYIEKNLKFSLQEVGLMVEEELRDYIMKNLYQSFSPKEYWRSYDYINSLSVRKVEQLSDGSYHVEIYFDTNKIIPNEVEDSYWNQHMDVDGNTDWNGMSIPEWLPIWIETGTEGSLWDRKGIHAVENTIKEFQETKRHVHKIKELLAQKGINAVVV